MSATGPTDLLAAWACSIADDPVEPAVREKATLCLLDALGLAAAADAHPAVRATEAITVDLTTDQPGATVWSSGRRVPVRDAILANGVATHAHFHDDTDMDAWAHPGSLIVPVALSLAEVRGRDLEAALRGVISGYAALNWLGAEGVVGHALVERGFRAGPCLGTIAAAVAASTVLGLGPAGAHSAVGLAADVTGGILEPVRSGAQDWRWQNGGAAARGATAALLAEAGMLGPPDPLTGPCGFLPTFAATAVPDGWTRPPRADALHRVWFKPYPILGDNMAAAVTAALLHPVVGGELDGVRRIEVHINADFAAYPGTSYRGPFDTPEQAMASTAFAVAALLVRGHLDHPGLLEATTEPQVGRLVETVAVVGDTDLDHLQARVTVHTATAQHTRHSSQAPRAVFHRDRAQARRAYAASPLAGAGDDLPEALFGWLDGGPAPTLARVCGRRTVVTSHSPT